MRLSLYIKRILRISYCLLYCQNYPSYNNNTKYYVRTEIVLFPKPDWAQTLTAQTINL